MGRFFRPRVLLSIVLGFLVFYTLFGFVLLPYGLKAYAVPAIAEHIKHPVVLREAAFNPFTLALRLQGLEIREQDQAPILGFEEFVVNLRATTLFLKKVAFDEIRLIMPFVAAKVNREGKLNLVTLIPPADETVPPPSQEVSEPKKMMPVQVDLLEIDQGIVEYRDESKPRPVVIDVVPFQIMLRNFSTVEREGENVHAFTAEIGKGEKISWEGTIFLEPMESDGRVTLSGIKLKTLYQAVHNQFQFDIPSGTLDLSVPYHFDLRGQAPQTTVNNGTIAIRNLAIGERGGIDPVMNISSINIDGIQLDLQKQTVNVAKVHSADARFDAWMDPGGVINYQTLFASASTSIAPAPSVADKPQKAPESWAVTVDEIALQNYRAAFEDRTLARPGHVDISAMNFTVKNVQVPFKKPLPVDLSLKLNETGTIGVQGKVLVEPLTADAELKLEHIAIQPFQPYLDQFLNADVQDGAIDLKGTIHFAKEHQNEPMLRFQGDLALNQLAVVDRKEFDTILSWKTFAVNRVALDVDPTAVKIAEVLWQEPSVQMVMEADGQLNVSRLAVPPPSSDQASSQKKEQVEKDKPKGASAEPVPVTIDQVKIVKLAALFQDLSVEPSVKTGLTDFGGTIKGLSSKQLKKADVNLVGKVGRTAPLKIVGKINPLSEDTFTDLVITLGGMDLRPTGPYSGKYVGYGLSKGKLSLDLKYKVSQKVLEAENLVRVDQLTFGEKTNSPDATSLPVPLVVGLLKDRKGMIEIDMPIRGNLNDPDFKYGKVVISTLFNLLGKVVASPFALIGKLVPGGGSQEDLQFIEFEPGNASLLEHEVSKIDALEKALNERAGLRLDIKGTSDPALDRAALQAMKLREQLFTMSGKDPSGQAELSQKEEQRLIEKLYAKLPSESTQLTIEEMKQKVAQAIEISDNELETLARQRAEIVRNHLLEGGSLTEARVSVLDPGVAESGHEKVRTQLTLSAGT